MAKPRIFVSSTYFDLKSVRADLEFFIKERGFEPVLHERGAVPYGNTEALEKYCYREIESCDIVISIIGGRFGSKSVDSTYSISQTELKVARDTGKQVYIFIENQVYHEFKTYKANPEVAVKWVSVDSKAIFEFISEIFSYESNNPIMPFETSYDIIGNLKEQWAGLFQRLLSQQAAGTQLVMFQELKQSVEAARSLMDMVAGQADQQNSAVAEVILTSHPLFTELRRALNVNYRFVAEDLDELNKWFRARGFHEDLFRSDGDDYEWFNNNNESVTTIIISIDVFSDDGKILYFNNKDWKDEWVKKTVVRLKKGTTISDPDDDIPF